MCYRGSETDWLHKRGIRTDSTVLTNIKIGEANKHFTYSGDFVQQDKYSILNCFHYVHKDAENYMCIYTQNVSVLNPRMSKFKLILVTVESLLK
jgi:hypothetical protein